jgi:AbiV family abortive infection protein
MAKQWKRFPQYRGQLSAQWIADGINVATRNAKRLLDDATVLFEAKRFPSACALAILSIEESGKPAFLRALAGVTDEQELKSIWKRYRDHQAKNVAWIVGEIVAKGAKTFGDFAPIFDKNSDHPALLDSIKQLGFYTDCYETVIGERAAWAEPDTLFKEKFVKGALGAARRLLPKQEVTAREIELWIELFAKVYGGVLPPDQAIHNFLEAMDREGSSSFTFEEVQAFYAKLK